MLMFEDRGAAEVWEGRGQGSIREVATGVLDLAALHHAHSVCRRELARETNYAEAGRDDFAGVGEDLQGDLAFVRRKEVADKGHSAHLRRLRVGFQAAPFHSFKRTLGSRANLLQQQQLLLLLLQVVLRHLLLTLL